MSIFRNRSRLSKSFNRKEYNILMKSDTVDCYHCMKTSGSYYGTCHPIKKRKGITAWRFRMYRNWKNNRKTQWKI